MCLYVSGNKNKGVDIPSGLCVCCCWIFSSFKHYLHYIFFLILKSKKIILRQTKQYRTKIYKEQANFAPSRFSAPFLHGRLSGNNANSPACALPHLHLCLNKYKYIQACLRLMACWFLVKADIGLVTAFLSLCHPQG